MELVRMSIPAAFIGSRVDLSWREVAFGMDNELLAPGAAIEFAIRRLEGEQQMDPLVVELAGLRSDEPQRQLVVQLAAKEPDVDRESITSKWAFLVLAWLFEHRAQFDDPFEVVANVYADFGYPEEVASFVPYMPRAETEPADPASPRERLLSKWKRYLEESTTRYRTP